MESSIGLSLIPTIAYRRQHKEEKCKSSQSCDVNPVRSSEATMNPAESQLTQMVKGQNGRKVLHRSGKGLDRYPQA